LISYCDDDWPNDPDDRHSTTSHLFLSVGNVISWLSKKQAVVALSTSKAECIALCSAAQKAVWLRRLLNSFQKIPGAVVLMEGNQGAIALSQNPVEHARTKHVNIRYYLVFCPRSRGEKTH